MSSVAPTLRTQRPTTRTPPPLAPPSAPTPALTPSPPPATTFDGRRVLCAPLVTVRLCCRDGARSYAPLLLSLLFSKYQNWGRRVKAFDIGALPFLLTASVLASKAQAVCPGAARVLVDPCGWC